LASYAIENTKVNCTGGSKVRTINFLPAITNSHSSDKIGY